MLHLTLLAFCTTLALANPVQKRDGYKIPSTSFNSQTDFNTYWSYNYPWGTDHNGGARMNPSQVAVGGGQLTLTATPVTGQAPTSGGIAINYLSGTVYAKEFFTVEKTGGYEFIGQFLAPTARGCWPAFWLTGDLSWPPEIDLAEWKGNGDISFNTLGVDGASWISTNVPYSPASSFHTVKIDVRDSNGVDAVSNFYLDGVLKATQIGKGMVGLPFWLIIDFQMDGSSGSPGPTTAQTYAVKGFTAYSYNP